MKGFKRTIAGLVAGSSTAVCLAGCWYSDQVDPCWPERYNHMARHSVVDTLNVQAANGHVLDQTIWNWHFETELDPQTGDRRPTAKLHPAGMDHLKYLVRRLPCADTRIFLQTAQEIAHDPDNVDGALKQRAELDAKRQQAIYSYLAFTAGGRTLPFQVVVIDPAEVGIAATPIGGIGQAPVNGAVQQMYGGFKGALPTSAGGFTSGAPGGASGASSSSSSSSGSSGVPK